MRPTREGRVSPSRPGLIYKGIGVDPGTETDDPDPPPDQAEQPNGQAFIPYLPPPDPGEAEDLNLAFGTDSDGGGDRAVVNPTFANDGDLTTNAERISYYNGSGTDTWWVEADLGAAYEVEEIVVRGSSTNPTFPDPPWEIEHSPDGSTWTPAVGTYVFNAATNPKTATLTLTSSETKRYWRVGHSVGVGFIYAVKIFTWQINGLTGGTDPTNIIWTNAPAVQRRRRRDLRGSPDRLYRRRDMAGQLGRHVPHHVGRGDHRFRQRGLGDACPRGRQRVRLLGRGDDCHHDRHGDRLIHRRHVHDVIHADHRLPILATAPDHDGARPSRLRGQPVRAGRSDRRAWRSDRPVRRRPASGHRRSRSRHTTPSRRPTCRTPSRKCWTRWALVR